MTILFPQSDIELKVMASRKKKVTFTPFFVLQQDLFELFDNPFKLVQIFNSA